MYTGMRIGGGVLFVVALFLRPFYWNGSQSAFQIAAYQHGLEAIAIFLASLALGVTATISTFFTKRVIEWLEMTLTVVPVCGIAFFLWRFSVVEHNGVTLTWAGLSLVAGLAFIALGANGRYRNTRSE
jgi:hypothetical protein